MSTKGWFKITTTGLMNAPPAQEAEKEKRRVAKKRPKYGNIVKLAQDGSIIETKAVSPGLDLQDLMNTFHEAEQEAGVRDPFSNDPTKWPNVMGVQRVAEMVIRSMEMYYYDKLNERVCKKCGKKL